MSNTRGISEMAFNRTIISKLLHAQNSHGLKKAKPWGRKEVPFLQTETETQTKMTHISASCGQDASKHIKPQWLAEDSYGFHVPSFCSNAVTRKFITAYINVFFSERKKALVNHGDFCSNIKLCFNFLVASIAVSPALKQWPQIPLCLHYSDSVVTAE